ncbi:MAG: hypothetical protein KGL39_25510 [Patescibacteria group bacterium]|nr:hypothetical protein [Patescibacteria group bacterium]
MVLLLLLSKYEVRYMLRKVAVLFLALAGLAGAQVPSAGTFGSTQYFMAPSKALGMFPVITLYVQPSSSAISVVRVVVGVKNQQGQRAPIFMSVVPVTSDMPTEVQAWGNVAIGSIWLAEPTDIVAMQIDNLALAGSYVVAPQ